MRLSAIDAVQRGLTNLRSNWELALLQMLQGLILSVLSLAGVVPIVLALGAGFLRTFWSASTSPWGGGSGPPDFSPYIERLVSNWPIFAAAIFGAFCVWTLAFVIYCYFQAGVLGELAAGDAKASRSASERPAHADFRIYSLAGFNTQGQAGVWKFFWLINLFAILGLLVILVFVLLLFGVVTAAFRDGGSPGAAIGLGCFSALFLVPIWIFLSLWSQLAKAVLVSGSDGIWDAFRSSFTLLFRRLGAVLLIALLAIVAGVAVSMVFMPLSLATDFALGDDFGIQIAADIVLMVLQSIVGAVLSVAIAAILIALARSEMARSELALSEAPKAGGGPADPTLGEGAPA